MNPLVELSKIFKVTNGNKLDLNKLNTMMVNAADAVNFVSRTSRNMGVSAQVERIENVAPFPPGLITVALGGSILSTNIQPKEFYTGQNVCVLEPIDETMSEEEKMFYCSCIEANKFRYSAFGREANRTLRSLKIPSRSNIPTWVVNDEKIKRAGKQIEQLISFDKMCIGDKKENELTGRIDLVSLKQLFEIHNGCNIDNSYLSESRTTKWHIPYVRPSKYHDGAYVKFVNTELYGEDLVFPPNTLYVSTNGQGSHSHAYVSNQSFIPNSDVAVLIPKREMTIFEKIYYAEIITSNRWLFSYGRKPKGDRLARMKLPAEVPSSILAIINANNIENLRGLLLLAK